MGTVTAMVSPGCGSSPRLTGRVALLEVATLGRTSAFQSLQILINFLEEKKVVLLRAVTADDRGGRPKGGRHPGLAAISWLHSPRKGGTQVSLMCQHGQDTVPRIQSNTRLRGWGCGSVPQERHLPSMLRGLDSIPVLKKQKQNPTTNNKNNKTKAIKNPCNNLGVAMKM